MFQSSCKSLCFKQKTPYELRISDWSSDVCSSDLQGRMADHGRAMVNGMTEDGCRSSHAGSPSVRPARVRKGSAISRDSRKIGRASRRERVCQHASISVVAGSLKKTTLFADQQNRIIVSNVLTML